MNFFKAFAVTVCVAACCLLCFSVSADAAEENVLMMATTTSTDSTGLLQYLAPKFKEVSGFELKWTAVGTGKALEYGKNCDVDVVLVHAPGAEKEYIEKGYGLNRREIMYNDFVLIGPAADPAGVKGKSMTDVLKQIGQQKAVFVSRGDDSGTHKKELEIWKATGLAVPDKESWYVQTGQGMLPTIAVAAERKGYTLTDRATYIKYESDSAGNPPLKILVEGDPTLLNQYSVIAVNPKNCPKVKYEAAMKFSDWIASAEVQQLIKDFKILGKQLFTPNAK
jgi:tungstate transport system substrate-binding protein